MIKWNKKSIYPNCGSTNFLAHNLEKVFYFVLLFQCSFIKARLKTNFEGKDKIKETEMKIFLEIKFQSSESKWLFNKWKKLLLITNPIGVRVFSFHFTVFLLHNYINWAFQPYTVGGANYLFLAKLLKTVKTLKKTN